MHAIPPLLLNRLLNRLAGLSLRHSKLIAILALVVGLASLAVGSRLTFEADPRADFGEASGVTGAIDQHIVVIHVPKGGELRQYRQLIDDIATGYRNSKRVSDVQYRVPNGVDSFEQAPIDGGSGYLLSRDRSLLLILARPIKPVRDLSFGRELLAEGAIIETRALAEWRKSAAPGTPMPEIEHTGGYQIAASDADITRNDVIRSVLVSFFALLALFFLAFRRIAVLLYAALSMALALAMTFAVAALTYGRLSSASAAFAALVNGLGAGLLTIFYARYANERNRGASVAEALVVTFRATGRGIVAGAIATAATFYVLLTTGFRGMTQLGVLTGSGILCVLLCLVFLMPSLIVMGERGRAQRGSKLSLHLFGTDRLIRRAIAHSKPTVIVWIVFMLLCAVAATRLTISGSIDDFRSPENAGVSAQKQVEQRFGPTIARNAVPASNILDATMRPIVYMDAVRATAIALAAALLVMIISLRNVKRVLLSIVPFIAGAIGMTGIAAMLQIELNFMNVFVPLMIAGCAITHAISMLQRYIEDPAAFPITAAETGKAVVTAGLTTIVGYGSFALSHFPGLRSIGYASIFGIGLSSLAAITLLPAILALGKRTNE